MIYLSIREMKKKESESLLVKVKERKWYEKIFNEGNI